MSLSEINSASEYDTSTDGPKDTQQSGPSQEISGGGGEALDKSTQSVEQLPAPTLGVTLLRTLRQPGQHGDNLSCCCRLRTGCFVVACILCLWGVGGVIRVLIIVNFRLASPTDKRVQSFEKISDEVFGNSVIAAVDSLGSVIFWFSAGILLLVGAWNIFRTCCLISCSLVLVGIVYELVLRGMVTLVVTQNIVDEDGQAKRTFLALYWIYFIVMGGFLAYTFVCARALYIQIKIGKYEKGETGAEPKKSSESTAKDSSVAQLSEK